MYKNLEALLPRFAEYFHNKFGQEKGRETIMNLGKKPQLLLTTAAWLGRERGLSILAPMGLFIIS